ncbi:DUF724 domain-containing protein 3-like isoform X2 [Salvia splendens]|uniref:DUF724 domain-containing protein 3-like isoform X2 n=1 Tax=Salvia splendens TaxID=180675 RepID=UPI001C25BE4E|nr:DUF724 domain-containing protein 3-like isoform X2 [Salvia splendens]
MDDAADALFELTPPNSTTPHSHSHRRRLHHFPIGSIIEVRTDEEDFKGVYFSAIVLPPPNSPKKSGRKRSRKLYVEYHNLLAHEDGSDRLREHIDASCVRPTPPQHDPVKGFDLDDVVDAFYKDGWWTGIISRVVADGERYTVTFHTPPDELEFGIGELRLHCDWVNGNWVRPQKQNIAGLMFDVGRKVEVSFDREDFQDAWFPATIREDLGNQTFLVECNSVNPDSHGSTKATVDSLHIRPCPPLLKDNNFILLEKVDAFFDFGWWNGIITKELGRSRYLVFFKQMKCEKEFNQSELRPHMDWKDGKWFTSAQEPSVPSLDDGVCQHLTPDNSTSSMEATLLSNLVNGEDTCGGKTHSSLIPRSNFFEKFVLDNQKPSHGSLALAKRRYVSGSGGALSQPFKKLREGNLVLANKKDVHDGSNKEISCGPESPKSLNNMRKQRNILTTQNGSGNIKSTSPTLGKGTAQMLPFESSQLGSGDLPEKEPDTARTGNTEEGAQYEHARHENEIPIVIVLPCAETGSSEKSGSDRSRPPSNKALISLDDQRHQMYDFTTGKITGGKQLEMEDASEKRKRGRPKRNMVESTGTKAAGSAEHGGQSSGDINLNRLDDGSQGVHDMMAIDIEASISDQEETEPNQETTSNSQSGPGKRKVRMTKRILASKHEESGVAEPVRLADNRSSKRGRKQFSSGRIAVKVRDSAGASGGESVVINPTLDVEKVIEPQPSNEFDNEPLSKWIEEMHVSSVIDGSRLPPVDTVMVPYTENGNTQGDPVGFDEASEMQPESGRQSSGLVDGLPSDSNITANVTDEGTQKQSESGRQSMPSGEETSIVLLDLNSDHWSEDEAQASLTVNRSPMITYQPLQSSVENTIAVVLDEDIEKRPESEAQATPTVDKSPESSVEKIVHEHFEDNEKQPENRTPAAASINQVALVRSETEKLPFVKNTILWKTIESMQVFQRLPQNPHFQPLENFKESSREGMAIGYMVTFSSTVERASKLQLTDPVSIMDDIKETLADLETHGFEVRPIQDCIHELLAMKDKQERLANDADTLNGQLTDHSDTKARLGRDIDEINEHIQKLQRKRLQVESLKEREDEEIALLQVRLRETKDSIKTVKSDFEGKVSSIL